MPDDPVTTIVLFHVPPESSAAFVAAWAESNAFMSAQPGLVGGTLFRSASDAADPQFVNVATWTSQAALDQARARHAEHLAEQGIDQREVWAKLGVTVSPASYHVEVRYCGPDGNGE